MIREFVLSAVLGFSLGLLIARRWPFRGTIWVWIPFTLVSALLLLQWRITSPRGFVDFIFGWELALGTDDSRRYLFITAVGFVALRTIFYSLGSWLGLPRNQKSLTAI
jgi:uncharacterized protein (DUF983 family)